MDTCPHGARIEIATGNPVVFIDPCVQCESLLADLGVESNLVPEPEYALAS